MRIPTTTGEIRLERRDNLVFAERVTYEPEGTVRACMAADDLWGLLVEGRTA